MDINEGIPTEDLWTPYKELVAVVEGYLAHESGGAPYAVHTFESVLRRHKQTFLALLKNPAKNPGSRDEIKRGITEGVNLPSVGRTLLSKELVDEAVIISDMYNVNEYLALELLHTAQRQLPRHPGLPRGLVAVLLYYDGRRALVQALKELVMSTQGVCWSINAREEIVNYVSRYIDQLISDGLLGNVLDALKRFTLEGELELLQANRAIPPSRHHHSLLNCIQTTSLAVCQLISDGLLGNVLDALKRFTLEGELELLQANRAIPPSRHHHSLLNCIQTTRKLLAGVIFAASAQRGLGRDILLRLLNEQTTSPTHSATGALDEISLALQMALLYALDLSVLHRREDGEELAKKLPLIQDADLISVLLDELTPHPNQSQDTQIQEKTSGVRALCQLALGLALAALKRAPQSLLRRGGGSGGEVRGELLDQDETLVDAAIDGKVFEYLDEAILSSDFVSKEEYYQRRIHTLITDFIVLMHSKLMEMRVNKAILSSDFVSKEEYYQRRIHTLITDFIVLMHSKLMEMRVKADEAARAVQMYAAEGLTPPVGTGTSRTRLDSLLRCVEKLYARDPLGLRHDYWKACDTGASPHVYRTRLDSLLRCVEKLYARDPLGLRHDYWKACDTGASPHVYSLKSPVGTGTSRTRLDSLLRCVEKLYARDPLGLRHDYWKACDTGASPHVYRAGGRAATLYKFVRLSGELVCASLLPAYLRALASLAVPKHTWALLARKDALSASHLLNALARYYARARMRFTTTCVSPRVGKSSSAQTYLGAIGEKRRPISVASAKCTC
ncbi:hypothetical protein NE865_09904 [Phthorimaea operculella]|nr:hypothetical protein NE865_09904 [Phthorimaea operculella]